MRETLAIVGTHFVNNAHDDYLELAVETGVFGPALLAMLFLWLSQRGIVLWHVESLDRAGRTAAFALLGLAALALHSIFDYPLRTQAILAVATLLLVCVAAAHSRPQTAP